MRGFVPAAIRDNVLNSDNKKKPKLTSVLVHTMDYYSVPYTWCYMMMRRDAASEYRRWWKVPQICASPLNEHQYPALSIKNINKHQYSNTSRISVSYLDAVAIFFVQQNPCHESLWWFRRPRAKERRLLRLIYNRLLDASQFSIDYVWKGT